MTLFDKKRRTICFSGYRPEKFAFIIKKGEEAYLALENRIKRAIIQAVEDGYSSFMCGMAMGFDLIVGSVVLDLKQDKNFSDILLIAVLPFEGHGFSNPWQVIHQMVLNEASCVVTLAPHYYRQAYQDRNRFMVDRSGRLICYYNGKKGGTDFTVKYAENNGLEIVNVWE